MPFEHANFSETDLQHTEADDEYRLEFAGAVDDYFDSDNEFVGKTQPHTRSIPMTRNEVRGTLSVMAAVLLDDTDPHNYADVRDDDSFPVVRHVRGKPGVDGEFQGITVEEARKRAFSLLLAAADADGQLERTALLDKGDGDD